MYLIKFLHILAISFFPCAIAIYNHAYSFYLSLSKLSAIYFFSRDRAIKCISRYWWYAFDMYFAN